MKDFTYLESIQFEYFQDLARMERQNPMSTLHEQEGWQVKKWQNRCIHDGEIDQRAEEQLQLIATMHQQFIGLWASVGNTVYHDLKGYTNSRKGYGD